MAKDILHYFDKLEDRVRIALSHRPIPYALIGGVGIVLFWKGVWETAEYFPILHGPGSVISGVVILLVSGLLVASFIGDSILISGLKHEKKLVEKAESEVRAETDIEKHIIEELEVIEEAIKKQQKPHA